MDSHALSVKSTKETTNYARLCRLLIDVGGQALRDKFNNTIKPDFLERALINVKPQLERLKKRKILNPIQWNCLYPLRPSTVSSGNFDITTLCVLLTNVCNFLHYSDCPGDRDVSLGADIFRIRAFRNSIYAHVTKAAIDDVNFSNYWSDIRGVILRIGGPSYEATIREVETVCMDPELAEFQKELFNQWSKDDENIREELDKLGEEVTDLKDQVAVIENNWKKEVADLKDEMENCNKELAEVKGLLYLVLEITGTKSSNPQREDPLKEEETERQIMSEVREQFRSNMEGKDIPHDLQRYLQSLGVKLKAADNGSLKITVECRTLEVLQRLWEDYTSGHLNAIAESYFLTDEMKRRYNVTSVSLKTTILEEDYLACKNFLVTHENQQPSTNKGECLPQWSGASGVYYEDNIEHIQAARLSCQEDETQVMEPGKLSDADSAKKPTREVYQNGQPPVKVVQVSGEEGKKKMRIAVKCPDLNSLQSLWEDYRSGHLNAVAERYLLTDDIKEKFGVKSISVETTILEKNYQACREYLSESIREKKMMKEEREQEEKKEEVKRGGIEEGKINEAKERISEWKNGEKEGKIEEDRKKEESKKEGEEWRKEEEEMTKIVEERKEENEELRRGEIERKKEMIDGKSVLRIGLRLPSIKTILRSNSEFVGRFSLCLDREMRSIQNWRHLASKLEVDATVIRRLEQYPDFGPTIRLFGYLELKQPDLTMRHLKDAFSEIKRNDLLEFLTTGASFDDSEKVKDVIRGGLLHGIALALDGSSRALSNWKTLALSFSVPRKAIRELERQSMESPSGKMFQYLATSAPGMKISSLKNALESLGRMDLFNFLQNQGDDVLITNVIVPGSDLHEKMTQGLNYEGPCIKNWKHVASKLKIPPDVYQNFDEFKQTRLSPTKEILEWVATRFPEKKLSDVAKALEEIQRNDVVQIISKHYPNAVDVELREESVCYGSLSDRTVLVGRGDICEDIVHALSLKKAVEIVAPPGYGKTEVVTEVAHRMLEGGKFVAYVKPRGCNCVEDLASEIIEAFGFFPGEKPISEVFHCISSMKNKNGLLIIENIDNLLHLEDQVRNDDYHKELKSKTYFTETCGKYSKNDFITFLKDIGQKLNVQLILTSRETYDLNVYFPTELVYLEPLNEDDSASMFAKCEDSLGDDVIGDLVRASRGIPRLICTLISALKRENPQKLARRLATSSAKALIVDLNPEFLADEDRIDKCLEISFERLGEENQNVLVMSSTFPYRFTLEQFEKVFGSPVAVDLQTCLNCLIQRSFLRYDKINCQYFLDRFFRDFFSLKPDHVEAKSTFIRYYSDLAVTLCETFLTKDCKSAIKQYRSERDNIREAMAWCGDDHPELDQSIREQYITAFNKAAVFLAKMMRKQEFQSLFCKLAYLCRSDLHLHSACLTNIGMKIVLSCTCTPHICPRALYQAKEILTDANDINSTLTNVKDSTRALCLSKLGFCCVREGRIDEGYGYLDNALKLRKKRTEESKKCKDHVMLAACYNDLAASQMVQRKHMLAIHTRMENVLPVYEEKLGAHPFTATTLNWIGNSYHALGKYDHAIAYNSRSLTIRKQLLGEHQETARSLYDLGVAYSAKKEYETALKYLEEAVKLQEKVLDTQDELIHTHQAISIALRSLGRTKEAEEEMNRAGESAKKVDSLRAPLKNLKIQERGEWVEYSQ